MKKWMIMLIISLSPNAFALFCPANLNMINYGDTIEQVIAQCGAPDSQKTFTSQPNVPQEWDYYLKADPIDSVNTKMAIIFKDSKILNITMTGPRGNRLLCQSAMASRDPAQIQVACGPNTQQQYTVSSTNLCGQLIQVGDSIAKVQNACGKPDFINQSQPQADQVPIEITEVKYLNPIQMTLIFENGRLTSRTR